MKKFALIGLGFLAVWVIFFLLVVLSPFTYGQNRMPPRSSINWVHGLGLYVVNSEVEPLRQMYRDIGRKVFSWSEYTPEEIRELNKTCLDKFGPDSFFVGDIKRVNKSIDSYCAGSMPFPPILIAQICFLMNLEIAWMKPEEKKFACRVPGPPKVRA